VFKFHRHCYTSLIISALLENCFFTLNLCFLLVLHITPRPSRPCRFKTAEYNGLHLLKVSAIMFQDLSPSDATEASCRHIDNSFPVPLIRTSSEHKRALIEKKKIMTVNNKKESWLCHGQDPPLSLSLSLSLARSPASALIKDTSVGTRK